MEDRHFDALSRRLGERTGPRLPRRGMLRLLGGTGLAAALGLAGLPEPADARKKKGKKNKGKNKKCKDDGKKCKRSKDCCDSKCEDKRCGGSSGRCGTKVSSNTTWGSFGSGDGQFRDPTVVATDRNGDVYVTDTGNSRIQVFDQNGGFIRRFGSQGNGVDRFQEPRGIGVNQESSNNSSGLRAYITDPGQSNSSHRFRKFRTSGEDLESLGRSGLSDPRGVAIDADNNVWVVDGASGEIFLFDRNGSFRTSWAPSGSGSLSSADGIGVYEDNDGSTFVYVTDRSNNRILKFEFTDTSSSGLRFVDSAGSQGGGSSSFNGPMGLAVDSCGNVWVADRINNRIQQLDKDLSFRSRFTSSFDRPTGVAVSPNGNFLYVADSANDQIQKFDLRK